MKRITSCLLIIAVLFLTFACKKIDTDDEVMGAIKNVAANCKIDLKYAFIKSCKKDEGKALSALVKKKGITASLGTISVALNDSDENIRAIACKLLYREVKDKMNSLSKNPEAISDDVVKNIIKGTGDIKTYVAFYAAASATHLAMIKGLNSILYDMVDSHTIPQVKYEAYENLMTYGRMNAFAKIQEIVKSNPKDRRILLAALKAPTRMYQYTKEETEEIGQWALQYISDKDDNIALYAGATLNRCAGKYIDAVLDECEKRAKDGNLKPPFSYVLSNYTFTCKKILSVEPTGTPEQCKRREELESKIENKK